MRIKGLTGKSLRKIGKDEGLTQPKLGKYVKFMRMRFPSERSYSYAGEWAHRFKTQMAVAYGDSQSRAILRKLRVRK